MISWEVFFGGRGRAATTADGTGDTSILLNPTNGASYTGTVLQTQQIASSKLRAIENGRWVVQVSPTGFSAFVDPDGDVLPAHRRQRAEGDHDGRAACAADATWYTTVRRLAVGPGAGRAPGGLDLVRDDQTQPGQSSSIRVTGPSLTSSTFISVRKRPVATVQPSVSQARDDRVDHRFGVFGSGSLDPARAAALVGVAVQRELADDKDLRPAARRAARSASDRFITPVGVVEHAQVPDLVRHPLGELGVSSCVTPTSTHRPCPISPAIRSLSPHRRTTTTRARSTRCTRARTD